jgi:hypothetical protein
MEPAGVQRSLRHEPKIPALDELSERPSQAPPRRSTASSVEHGNGSVEAAPVSLTLERRGHEASNNGGLSGMTTRERLERNVAIVEDRARGMCWSRIARRHHVSDRHARRVVAEHRDTAPSLLHRDPVEAIEETLAAYDAAIDDLAILASETRHDSTKLGAIKARLEVHRSRVELLQTVGVLPRDLGHIGVIVDVRRIAARLVAVLDRPDVPETVRIDILDAIHSHDAGPPWAP